MKKLVLGIGVLATSMAFAQTGEIGYGAKAGMNVSSVSGDNSGWSNKNNKIGYYAGVFVNVPVAEKFSIQPEVLYNNLGNKFETTVAGTKLSVSNHMNYISVPVMAQYNIAEGLYVEAGPQFNFLVGQNYKVGGIDNATLSGIADSVVRSTLPGKDFYKTFDFALGVGLGYKFYKNMGINARYVGGLTNNFKTDYTNIVKDAQFKNNAFQVGLTLGF
ncbi:MAG: PorT family protein [Cloacibacterium sp.]|nr:PorT family protein [Cloacibacterium sp.]